MLNHCTYTLFLAKEGNQTVGRISAFTDRLALDHWKQPIGLFGSFECIQDEKVGLALLGAAHDWLTDKGMKAMRGPWSFASQEWGLYPRPGHHGSLQSVLLQRLFAKIRAAKSQRS